MKKNSATEIKVGIFVLITLLALGYLSLQLGEEKIFTKKGYPVKAVFENVSGLVEGARVEMAGVEIGRVANISLANGKALVEMRIQEGIKISKDAQAAIRTKGVLGDRYVEIKQGQAKAYLSPGEMIAKTVTPMDLDQILTEIGPAFKDIREITAGIKEVLLSEEVRTNFKQMSIDIRQAAQAFREVNEKLAKGEGTLGKLIADDKLYYKLESIADNLNQAAEKINYGNGTLAKLLNQDDLYLQLEQTIDDLNQTTQTLKKLAQRVEAGEGTLGKLLTDDELYNQLNEAVKSLNMVAQKLSSGEGTLGKLLTDDSLYLDLKKTIRNVNQAAVGLQEQMPITILGTVGGMVLQ
ncbi:MlaD family protein [Thermodesulfatator autotrophicus]|uniref:Mammalian cell entry protein n=1 Tax=Thermodesulfatator autotrophicus TaxID=1795632 RepID=A0A177E5D1_9BACT|nr:MlaD family protein [Thermodesulfatator autotrophicus]OAG27177.1 mammalian cell entry protein [Thermodesulfatator autotrophicus]